MDEEQTQTPTRTAGPHPDDPVTTDFDVLGVDLSVSEPAGRAPDPLRSARPALLKRYNAAVAKVMAARRAGHDR